MDEKNYLRARCISQEVILKNKLLIDNNKVTIPVFDKDGNFLFNKYRWFNGNMKYSYDKGAGACLYNAQYLDELKQQSGAVRFIRITEGEFDCCVSQSRSMFAVSSTGGAGTFKEEWLSEYKQHFFFHITFDNDTAGISNAVKLYIKLKQKDYNVCITEMLPIKKLNDITDYYQNNKGTNFVNLHWIQPKLSLSSREYSQLANKSINPAYYDEFARLKRNEEELKKRKKKSKKNFDNKKDEIENAKAAPITDYINFNRGGFAECIFHNEKTASMKYYPKENIAKCFGCGEHADTIAVVMKIEGCNFPEALKIINKK